MNRHDAETITLNAPGADGPEVLQDAIDEAPPGSRILLGEGTYRESVTVSKSLTLVGAGADRTVVEGGCTVAGDCHAVLEELGIVAMASGPGDRDHALDIRGSRVEARDCALRTRSGSCVVFRGAESNVVLQGCTMTGGDVGILADTQAWGQISDCSIEGARSAGIVVSNDSAPRFVRCVIDGCHGGGIVVFGASSPRFEECEVRECGGAGIDVSDGSAPSFVRCCILAGRHLGVSVYGGAQGVFERCEMRGNNRANVAVGAGATPLFRECAIADGQSTGVFVFDGGSAGLDGCVIEGNGRNGIRVDKGSCRASSCTIARNEQHGVAALGQARVDLFACTFRENGTGPVSAGANATVRRCDEEQET